MIIVDTNVLIDVLENHPVWADWGAYQLTQQGRAHELIINPVIYSELSVTFDSMEVLHREIVGLELEVYNLPPIALFAAGKAFGEYRRRGGPRKTLLPDFYIGAHAAALCCPILTRDSGRFHSYFPSVELITPDTHRGFTVHEPVAPYHAVIHQSGITVH